MKKKTSFDFLTAFIIFLLITCSLTGILSLDFTKSFDVKNIYNQSIKMFGSGIYKNDTYLQGTISIGTDFTILLVLVPLFVVSLIQNQKENKFSKLKLLSLYGCSLYYSASLSFDLTYNKMFLLYVALFSCSLFGFCKQMFTLKWEKCFQIKKGLSIFLIICGTALLIAWLPDIIPSLITKTPLSTIGVYTTVVTYVLDMGIISPLCFITLYLLKKSIPMGTVLLALLLKLCLLVGIMMIPQTIIPILAGIEIPLPALITKSLSFLVLAIFAFSFNRQIYEKSN